MIAVLCLLFILCQALLCFMCINTFRLLTNLNTSCLQMRRVKAQSRYITHPWSHGLREEEVDLKSDHMGLESKLSGAAWSCLRTTRPEAWRIEHTLSHPRFGIHPIKGKLGRGQ